MLGDILAGFQLLDRFKKHFAKKDDTDIEVKSIASRIVTAFESHGVSRNQIPELFNDELDYYSCSSDKELLKRLTPQMVQKTAEMFGINKDWIEGSSNEVYEMHDFYKTPELFESYLKKYLHKKAKDKNIYAYALSSTNRGLFRCNNALIVIAEPICSLNGRNVFKYHLIGGWVFDYWKSRVYFAAICALLFKYEIFVIGRYVEPKWLQRVFEEGELLNYNFSDREGAPDFPSKGSFIVEEFINMPSSLIEGMDEEDGRAIPLAYQLWLALSDMGYMRVFPESKLEHHSIRNGFEQALIKAENNQTL
ncbi:hypothetical protein [Thalassotalea euphylliae]|uniref:Uncharacterized protein n=1 Tax=Thalassotalea euphylliae TaxID=1655234 RepID=A0A3E0UHE3_9GAMM|nr:hypothetical protein [Thalassotalea euphylliae]REL36299.1 hypothetical protein DXX92_13770 [Thalassotalea euphylliae]